MAENKENISYPSKAIIEVNETDISNSCITEEPSQTEKSEIVPRRFWSLIKHIDTEAKKILLTAISAALLTLMGNLLLEKFKTDQSKALEKFKAELYTKIDELKAKNVEGDRQDIALDKEAADDMRKAYSDLNSSLRELRGAFIEYALLCEDLNRSTEAALDDASLRYLFENKAKLGKMLAEVHIKYTNEHIEKDILGQADNLNGQIGSCLAQAQKEKNNNLLIQRREEFVNLITELIGLINKTKLNIYTRTIKDR